MIICQEHFTIVILIYCFYCLPMLFKQGLEGTLKFQCTHMICFFLKMIRQINITIMLRPTTQGYPSSSPGIFLKFIPCHPVINVNGKKTVEITVRNCILLFWRVSICAWYASFTCCAYSRRCPVRLINLSARSVSAPKNLSCLLRKNPFSFSS